ncbi:MAG: hypothetical protein ACIWVG_19035, partial [Gloeotrichia echinulata HAB0833]
KEIITESLLINHNPLNEDAVDVIKKLLQLTNTIYDSDRLSIATPKRSDTATPENHIVYGTTKKKNKFRPVANVRFRYSYMEIPGKKEPVFLGRWQLILV